MRLYQFCFKCFEEASAFSFDVPPSSALTAFVLAVAGGGGWTLRELISSGASVAPLTPSPPVSGSNCICEVSCPEGPACICPSPVVEVCQPKPWAAAVVFYLLSLAAAFIGGWCLRPRALRPANSVRHDDASSAVAELAYDPFDVPYVPASRRARRRVE